MGEVSSRSPFTLLLGTNFGSNITLLTPSSSKVSKDHTPSGSGSNITSQSSLAPPTGHEGSSAAITEAGGKELPKASPISAQHSTDATMEREQPGIEVSGAQIQGEEQATKGDQKGAIGEGAGVGGAGAGVGGAGVAGVGGVGGSPGASGAGVGGGGVGVVVAGASAGVGGADGVDGSGDNVKKARKKQYALKGSCNALAVQLFAIDDKYETR